MKIRKHVSEKALVANRQNAKKSSGPRDTVRSRLNATTHGFLAHFLRFKSPQEEAEFGMLLTELLDKEGAEGPVERALTQEIAINLWKLRRINGLDLRDFMARRKAAKAVLNALQERYFDNSEFFDGSGSRTLAQRGWDCSELRIAKESTNRGGSGGFLNDDGKNDTHLKVEVTLTHSLDCVLRLQSVIRRDLYRAIKALREIQNQRRQKDESR